MTNEQNALGENRGRQTKTNRGFWSAILAIGILGAIGGLTIIGFWPSPTHSTPPGRTRHILETIRQGITSYLQDFPTQLPPSEPDAGKPGYYGGAALLYYLNGSDGVSGLTLTTTESRTTVGPAKITRTYPARVQGVRVSPGVGFLDSWGNPIEYFIAYKDRSAWHTGWPRNPGATCADVYPRACNVSLTGTGDYSYPGSNGKPSISGLNLRVAAAKWLDGFAPDSHGNYPKDWQFHMVPVNMGGYILVSKGPDGLWGTSDDLGDVATFGGD